MTKAPAGPFGRRRDRRTVALLTALLTGFAVAAFTPAAAHAAAGGLLTVGMKLTFTNHDCSLGFFATDSARDQLAVTAGHCANGLREKVHNSFGQRIGEVVAWQPDAQDSHGKLTGSRGYTVVYIFKNVAIEPFFSGVGSAKIGEHVWLYGERTAGTNGTITDVSLPWSVLHPAPRTEPAAVVDARRLSPSDRSSRKSDRLVATAGAFPSTRKADQA
jgi:hypothetical protein